MTWVAVAVEAVAVGSCFPAYSMCCTITSDADSIGSVKLHSSGGGPRSSWLPSMSIEVVTTTIDYLYELVNEGTNIVSWGGLDFFKLFLNFDLNPEHRRRLHHVLITHFDLKTAYLFGLNSKPGNDIETFFKSAPVAENFPSDRWLSGVRSWQMEAIQYSIETLVFLSNFFYKLDHAYFEDGRNISVGALANGDIVAQQTFSRGATCARRLSNSLQDEITNFI